MRKITSSTTMPSSAATSYSRNSPPLASPRHTRIFTWVAGIRELVASFCEQLLQVRRHRGQRLFVELQLVGSTPSDEVELRKARIRIGIVAAGVTATALGAG